MDYLSVNKINHLYWLGRYQARVGTLLFYMSDCYDKMIDGSVIDYKKLCQSLAIPCTYKDEDDFMKNFLFDKENPDSLCAAANAMLGNGMMLRETIGTATLSYIEMALATLKQAKVSPSPVLCFQKTIDYLLAFIGSCDYYIDTPQVRYILACGTTVEMLDMYLRLEYDDLHIEKMLRKLLMATDVATINMDSGELSNLKAQLKIIERGGTADRNALLRSAENLFLV